MRFIAGAAFAARALTKRVLGQRSRTRSSRSGRAEPRERHRRRDCAEKSQPMTLSPRAVASSVPADPLQRGPGALIIGGAHGSLAVARSLGRKGIPVWFVTHDHPIADIRVLSCAEAPGRGPDDAGRGPMARRLRRASSPRSLGAVSGRRCRGAALWRNATICWRSPFAPDAAVAGGALRVGQAAHPSARRRGRGRFRRGATSPLTARRREARLPVSGHSQADRAGRSQSIQRREGLAGERPRSASCALRRGGGAGRARCDHGAGVHTG